MRETEYAYAVARVRSNETSLLTSADIEQLVSAPDVSSAKRLLSDKGWDFPEGGDRFEPDERELEKAWTLIRESAPDAQLLDAMIITNDYKNLKAALKCNFSEIEPSEYYSFPSVTDPEIITEAVRNFEPELLPKHLSQCMVEAYEAISKRESGQLAETVIDRYSLQTAVEFAEKSESKLLKKITALAAASADIKIALRSAQMGKSEAFAIDAMSGASSLNAAELYANGASFKNMSEYLKSTEYEFLSECVEKGFAEFEKECDNAATKWLEEAKYETFGPDPLVAYYYAKLAESKNVRIILSAKTSGIPSDIISERVRDLYV